MAATWFRIFSENTYAGTTFGLYFYSVKYFLVQNAYGENNAKSTLSLISDNA